jgi:hypothetical protein
VSYQPLTISEEEVDKLRVALGAKLDRIRATALKGQDWGTIEVTAGATCDDLSPSQEIEEKIKDGAKAKQDLVFDHPDFGAARIRVSTRNGTIYFVKAVPEVVMDYVFEAVARIKGIVKDEADGDD